MKKLKVISKSYNSALAELTSTNMKIELGKSYFIKSNLTLAWMFNGIPIQYSDLNNKIKKSSNYII